MKKQNQVKLLTWCPPSENLLTVFIVVILIIHALELTSDNLKIYYLCFILKEMSDMKHYFS
jgi:hypothetical protein